MDQLTADNPRVPQLQHQIGSLAKLFVKAAKDTGHGCISSLVVRVTVRDHQTHQRQQRSSCRPVTGRYPEAWEVRKKKLF